MTVQLVGDELLPAGSVATAAPPDLDRRPEPATTCSGCSRLRGASSSSLDREMKKLPTLRGRTVVNLFFESSTRTSSSFELAAKRLSADVMSVKSAGSSVDKGESLKDTALTLAAYDPDVIVIRHPADRRAAPRRAGHRRARGQRRRRQAPAPDTGAARPVHDRAARRPGRGAARRDRRRRARTPASPARTSRRWR